MSARRARELMEKVQAGEPVDAAEFGEERLTTERFEVSDEVMVGKSVRVPMAVFERVRELADRQGVTYSDKLRQWILDGLARETGAPADPLRELDRAVALVRQEWQQRGDEAA